MTRLKYSARVIAGQSPESTDVSELGADTPFLQGNAEFGPRYPTAKSQCSAPPKSATIGDVLVSVRAPVGALNIADQSYGIGRGLAAVRPLQIDSKYLWWWLHTQVDVLQAQSTGSTFSAVSASDIANLLVPVGDSQLQRAIARFLDRETAQIDALIGKQERLIELLQEKRRAITSDYVAITVRPSADEPGTRLKHLYEVIDERANGAALPLMSVSIHRGLQRRDEITDDEPRADDLSNYKVCRPGDVVINRMRAFQGALGYSAEQGLVSPDYLILRPHKDVAAAWLSAVLRSHWAVGEMRSRLRGIGSVDQGVIRTPRINASDLGEIRIRKPDVTAQRAFLLGNQDAMDRLDVLTNKAATAIALLRERRSALISAAVTGQIEVGSV